jgi:hypothetical protein
MSQNRAKVTITAILLREGAGYQNGDLNSHEKRRYEKRKFFRVS